MRRQSIHSGNDDLIVRAFLRQPLILYLHQADLAEGDGPLLEAASQINALGEVAWRSPTDMARTNYVTWSDDSGFHVRMCSGEVAVDVPEGMDRVHVHVPRVRGLEGCSVSAGDSGTSVLSADPWGLRGEPLVASGPTTFRIVRPAIQNRAGPRSRTAQALPRRAVSELRDRLQPLRP
jgi:hypothetical protein